MVVDERKYKRKVLIIALISLAVYTVLFSTLIAVGDFVLSRVIISQADKDITIAKNEITSKEPIDIFEANSKYPKVSIAYFDANGKLLQTKGNYVEVYDKLGEISNVGKIVTSPLNLQRYRTACYKLEDNSIAETVKIYYALEPLYDVKKLVMIYVTVAFIVVLFIVVLVSFLVSIRISKPYMELAKKNNQLIYDTAHELNTPLAVVSTQVQNVIKQPTLDEQLETELEIANEELARMKRMIKEMLNLAKVENDITPFVIEKVDISKVVNETVEPYMFLAESQSKTFNLSCACNQFNTDKDRLKQMLHIVLDNAIKYTNEGDSISLTIKKEMDKLKITIADTGIGVPEKDLEKIFNKFYRVDESRTKSTGGNGIGLALLKAIVFKMGGKLLASHNHPKGLKLEISLVEKPIK